MTKTEQEMAPAKIVILPGTNTASCHGAWNIHGIVDLDKSLRSVHWPATKQLIIDGSGITSMDSSGAWRLYKLVDALNKRGYITTLVGFSLDQQHLLALITDQFKELKPIKKPKRGNWLILLGKKTVTAGHQFASYASFIGEMATILMRHVERPFRFHWNYLIKVIETAGFQALPIIALLSFMIGIVLAYQMGLQLRDYGANIYVVDLIGVAVLREFGPLLTAIMVAGRSGSAFTAQLGTMQVNEEIDALKIMGLTPGELLVLPRLGGLLIALPLLTIWADIFGVIGGMLMSKGLLNISFAEFLHRFQQQVKLRSLIIGVGKAPVFALIIGSIGCFQGFQVIGSAESVGYRTTKSVVQAIFMIIVADAAFSILFSKLNI